MTRPPCQVNFISRRDTSFRFDTLYCLPFLQSLYFSPLVYTFSQDSPIIHSLIFPLSPIVKIILSSLLNISFLHHFLFLLSIPPPLFLSSSVPLNSIKLKHSTSIFPLLSLLFHGKNVVSQAVSLLCCVDLGEPGSRDYCSSCEFSRPSYYMNENVSRISPSHMFICPF